MRRTSAVLLVALLGSLAVSDAAAIPAWARKYNMNCSGCHYPAPPRLNATGIRFRWAGYRMPEEIGEGVTVAQIANYISAQGQVVFSVESQEGQDAVTGVEADEATLFYGGPFGRNFLGWFEFEREVEDGEAEFGLASQVGGVWGRETSYRGFKAGMGHWLADVGIAGFDRAIGFTRPLPLAEPLTGAVPFAFAGDRPGAEIFWATGRNRLSAIVLDAIPGVFGDVTARKDFAITNQLILDGRGGGLMLAGYFGSVLGVVDDTAVAATRSNYWRLAVSASRIVGHLELLGGLVVARDNDLPVGGASPFTDAQLRGSGYWLSGQYFLSSSGLALFGRYEFADPNTSAADDALRRYVVGGVLPLTLPEYLRATVEYSLRRPQAAAEPRSSALAAGLRMAF
jgi:hypothetical protein